jgi:hypothetical protein
VNEYYGTGVDRPDGVHSSGRRPHQRTIWRS